MRLFFFISQKSSRQVAKDRLKILLISDRVKLLTGDDGADQNDIAHVISKYMKIDTAVWIFRSPRRSNRQEYENACIIREYPDPGSEELNCYIEGHTKAIWFADKERQERKNV